VDLASAPERSAQRRVARRRESRATRARSHLVLDRSRLVALPAGPALVVACDGPHVLVVLGPHLEVLLAGGDRRVEVAVLAVRVGQFLEREGAALLDLPRRVADRRAARAAAAAAEDVVQPEPTAAAHAEHNEADGKAEREEDEDPLGLAPKLREE